MPSATASARDKTTPSDAAILRRRLARFVRDRRERARLTQDDVSKKLRWSLSKVIRIEAGENHISQADLKELAALLHFSDALDQWLPISHASRKLPFSEYKDVHDLDLLRFFAFEAAAQELYQFEDTFMPGPLQSEAYTHAVLADAIGLAGQQLERIAEARLRRQEMFSRADGSTRSFLVDQSVIVRPVGNASTMRDQLDHLLKLGEQESVTIRVLPHGAGATPGMLGPFVRLRFDDPADPDIVYVEQPRAKSFVSSEPEETKAYAERWSRLEAVALDVDASRSLISEVMGGML